MSTEISSLVWKHSKQKGSHLLLLAALADYANQEGWCWPSIKSLCQRTRMGDRYVQKMLAAIREDGELEIVEKSGSSNSYRVTVIPSSPPNPSSPTPEPQFTPPPNPSSPRTVRRTVKEPSSTVIVEFPLAMNSPEVRDAWNRWMTYLRSRRLTPSTHVAKMHMKALEAMGAEGAIAAIDHSIESQYRKPFPPPARKMNNGKVPKPVADYSNGGGFGETRHLRFDE